MGCIDQHTVASDPEELSNFGHEITRFPSSADLVLGLRFADVEVDMVWALLYALVERHLLYALVGCTGCSLPTGRSKTTVQASEHVQTFADSWTRASLM